MLQPLMRMSNITMLWHIGFKEFFCLLYLPDAQPGGIVDLLLKKYRHGCYLRFKIVPKEFLGKRF